MSAGQPEVGREVETLGELVRELAALSTAGYADQVEWRLKHVRVDGEVFVAVDVRAVSGEAAALVDDYLGVSVFGEWTFWADDAVMQVQ